MSEVGPYSDKLKGEIHGLLDRVDGLEAELKRVKEVGEIVVAELEKHGWGDMHYQVDAPQEQSVREAIAAWRAVVPEEVPTVKLDPGHMERGG